MIHPLWQFIHTKDAEVPVSMPTDTAWAEREALLLAPYAMFSAQSEGREQREPPHPYRSPFQRDRDRILHSAAFRRLSGKMQVFTGDMGDYHRTRLTHTHEVASVARTMGRVLRLNEDLIEALALLHDIGHPPYGHCGEEVLQRCMANDGGFSHNAFALVLCRQLERRYTDYPGLNLTAEVLSGQAHRSHKESSATPLLEVQVVDTADSFAYNAHDLDDALKLGLLDWKTIIELPVIKQLTERVWHGAWPTAYEDGDGERAATARRALVHAVIDSQVADFVQQATAQLRHLTPAACGATPAADLRLQASPEVRAQHEELSAFLFQNVYRHPRLVAIRHQAGERLQQLFDALVQAPERLPPRFRQLLADHSPERTVGYYLAGMTDRFCDELHQHLIVRKEPSAPDWA
jgi:dGTPase